ncbi:MAG: hypothetical protein KatS3mg081_2906 [Gemmatimonadales bacterium]|nr:MAG: hypothetical protein KatS3mg081_2906 [Gemmatimonadales bacterium]
MPTQSLRAPDPQALAGLADRYQIRLLLLHGSYAKNTIHSSSDLDLAVLLHQPERWRDIAVDLIADLHRLFPGHEIDLVFLHRADPLLAWHILRDGKPLIGNPGDLENRRRYAWRLYVEYGGTAAGTADRDT